MQKLFTTLLILFFFSCGTKEVKEKTIISSDVPNFWNAYDQIIQTKDSLQQIHLIDSLFIRKGTPGLNAIMKARRYTAASYVDAINKYPKFWNSVRANTLKAENYSGEIEKGIELFQKLYPDHKPAKMYFTIGALKTGGTTLKDKVLIGSEIAMADEHTFTEEIAIDFSHLPPYFKTNPIQHLTFLNVHEFIHTQQDTTIGNSVLSQTLIEGVAEFITEKALNIDSPNPQIAFGKKNNDRLKNVFIKEMFSWYQGKWFWANSNNEFGMGDLGYYMGYAICDKYYNNAEDKDKAIKDMIELDYTNEKELWKFVDQSKYFDTTIAEQKKINQKNSPTIVSIKEFENNAKNVDPNIKTMSIVFSEKMNDKLKNLRLGPLGESNLLEVTGFNGWSKDGTTIFYEIKLKPNLQQQILITDIFQSAKGYFLEPTLIDITTR